MTPPHEIRNAITAAFEYRVVFSDGVLHAANPVLAELMPAASGRARAAVFVDRGLHEANPDVISDVLNYAESHRQGIELALAPQIVAGGEAAKRDLKTFEQCATALHDARLDRHSYVIAIGGGAMLDAVGFAASTVHRGLRQIRLPTTALAQNDAGIGVKNGIDYLGKKNFLGCFQPPHAVVNDFTLLRTLPKADWRNGSAEAVKVALIRDAAFFAWLEQHAQALAECDEPAMRRMIRRCAELHLAHLTTSGDPFERGSARPLDFGHWAAHKLEQLSNFQISHGHAVAVGIAIDVLYSHAIGLLDAPSLGRIFDCLKRLGFRLDVAREAGLKGEADLPRLLEGVTEFQEHLGGQLCLILLRQIASPVEIHELDHRLLRQCCARVLFS